MKYLKKYDLEETYINEESSIDYFKLSYTKDTEYIWVKEKPQYLEMKFKVIAHKANMDMPDSIEYNENSDLLIGNKICNDFSIFKKIIINDGEPIDLMKDTGNSIQINSETVYSDNGLSLMTPLIDSYQNVQIVLDEPLGENDFLVINLFNDPENIIGFNENLTPEFNIYFKKINNLTYELTEDLLYILSTENIEYSVFGFKGEGLDSIIDNGYVMIECAPYIINTTLKYGKKPDVYLPMELDKEYIVKGELKNGIYSLPYGLFSNDFNNSEVVSLDGTSDTNNIYGGQFINLTEINIPKNIYEISDEAFSNNISLNNITFESNNMLKYIGASAFTGCDSLSSIDIPDSVTSIGNYAFNNCISLTSITIPNGVTTIDNNVFTSCESLTNITIPNSVTSIGNDAFQFCNSLSEITCLAETAPTVSSKTFQNICRNGVLYYPQGSDYSSWLSTDNLGEYNWIGVELQDAYDFKVNFITNGVKVESPYNSLSINGVYGVIQDDNSYLFSGLQPINGCYEFDLIADSEVIDTVDIRYKNKWITVGDNSTMLTCVYNPCQSTTIYSNLTYSGAYVDGVYVGTLSSSYEFNDVSEHIIQYEGVTTIGEAAFGGCTLLTSIDIPNSVTEIGNTAFGECTFLTSIDIPNSVTSIGEVAFGGCTFLTSIDIPNSVTSIGNMAFTYCKSLSEITFEEGSILNSIGEGAFIFCISLSSIDIPNSVTSIGEGAFGYCISLSSITIPSGVTSIGEATFGYCTSLTSIDIPSGVTTIGEAAFAYCTSLTSIDIPNNVTSIGGAFYGCYSLSSITIPDNVISIGEFAFTYCSSLSSITIPSGVTSIGEATFAKCYSLSEITIPNGITTIGEYAFTSCYSLSEITIPNNVTSIGTSAFTYCKLLSEITCLATTAPTISSNIFSGICSNGVLYYPGLNSTYDAWKQYLPNWDFVPSYTPQECTNLVISAENVNGRATSTTISYTATTNVVDSNGNFVSGIEVTGTTTSEPFSQNNDTENEVIRTVTFEYMGVTASTTITQGVWINSYYTIDLNEQWQLSTSITNPDSSLYDGVYESFSNQGVDSGTAICTITIYGYENFKLYVRSYAERSYDYVVVSNLDCTLSNDTTSGTSVKMTTKDNQQSGTEIDNYTEVEFSDIDGGEHTIQIMYRKDGSANSNDDRGYLLIPINQ